MANEVSLNTSLLNGNGFSAPMNLGITPSFGNNSASIWTSGNQTQGFSQPSTSNAYSDDFMMSGVDFSSYVYDPNSKVLVHQQNQPQTQNQTQSQQPQLTLADNNNQNTQANVPQQPVGQLAQNPTNGEPDFSELNNYLVRNDKSKQEDKSSNSNIGKTTGAIIGLGAPIGEKVLTAAKSKSLTKGFFKSLNWKTLAVTSPIVALAGFGIGYMIDGLINAVRSNKKEDTVAQQPAQTQLQQAA